MIQGDEPMITPNMISKSLKPLLEDEKLKFQTLMEYIETVQEHQDPAEVKWLSIINIMQYIFQENLFLLEKGVSDFPMLKQVCIIPFEETFLLNTIEWINTLKLLNQLT